MLWLSQSQLLSQHSHSHNKKLTKAALTRCWRYRAMRMQMLLVVVVQPHGELHSPFLNAAAETSEGIFVEDFPDPSQLSPLGKASSWAPKIAPAWAAPVTQLVSGSEHISAPQASSSCQSLMQAVFTPPHMWLGNMRNINVPLWLSLPHKKEGCSRQECCCSRTNPNPCPWGSHAGLIREAVITKRQSLMQLTPVWVLSSCFTQLETAQRRSHGDGGWLEVKHQPEWSDRFFFANFWELGAAQQIWTTKREVQGSEWLIPCLLRVIKC